jgi:hypothetical protein
MLTVPASSLAEHDHALVRQPTNADAQAPNSQRAQSGGDARWLLKHSKCVTKSVLDPAELDLEQDEDAFDSTFDRAISSSSAESG